jgi:hypothetical protein
MSPNVVSGAVQLQASPFPPSPGDVLSPSGASQFLGCGFKWFCKHVLKLPDPKTGALLQGSCVHAALAENYRQKLETQCDLPAAGVKAIYADTWGTQAKETEFRDDEEPDTLKAEGEVLTLKYLDEQAPAIEPAAVELPVMGEIGGVRVRGIIDLLDTSGRIIDVKTAARTPSRVKVNGQERYEVSPDYRFQVATYRQLEPRASGVARVDTLVKIKVPKLVDQEITIDAADLTATKKLYPLVQRGIRGGFFQPNRSHFMCSKRYCAFWRACEREFGGRVE